MLQGMFNEARGRMDEAQQWYEQTMEKAKLDQGALKRQVAQVTTFYSHSHTRCHALAGLASHPCRVLHQCTGWMPIWAAFAICSEGLICCRLCSRLLKRQHWRMCQVCRTAGRPLSMQGPMSTVQIASRGDTAMAITLLTKYVTMYANDLEAWEELASMYLQVRPAGE